MTMFCYQCEQTAKGSGCTVHGVCGKNPEVARLQDCLLHATKGIGMFAHRARELGAKDGEIDVFVPESLFSTLTNVDFDPDRLEQLIRRAAELRDKAKGLYEEACKKAGRDPEALDGPAAWQPAPDRDGLGKPGEANGIEQRKEKLGEDVAGLEELIMYGLKGMAA